MNALSAIVASFSMFSRIPMPRLPFREESMRYLFCAFPLVGLAVAGAMWAFLWAAGRLGLSDVLVGAVCAALPVLVTGGIHLDGLCDTADALSCYGERDKKLAILKDPHIGAFGAIYLAVFLLTALGLYAELASYPLLPALLCCVFVLSRAVTGWAVVAWPSARPDGLARTFAGGAKRRPALTACALWAAAALALAAFLSVWAALALAACFGLCALLVRRMAMRQFGGMTGDIAGFLIQTGELCALIALLLAEKIGGSL